MGIDTIAVLGGGTMGNGIAQVAAAGGYRAVLFDVSREALDRAVQTITGNLRKGVDKGKIAAGDMDAALGRLSTETDFARAVADADLVIEAVPEEIGLKIDLFRKAHAAAQPGAIFASNTSALSVTEMAAASGRPERFIGMHFFNPVHLMRLVEVIRGLETAAATLDATLEVARRMGKETVEVRESPGFVTSRMNALIGNEAFRMLEEGVASPEGIDKAIKLGLNHPMGPFEMVDLVGLDVRLSILEFLHRTLGDRFRPTPLMVQYVKAGRLGRKVRKGVYRYDADGNRIS